MAGFIYLLKNKENNGLECEYKIGATYNIEKRLKQYNNNWVLITKHQCDRYFKIEKKIIKAFAILNLVS